jgi:hypothetical protein
MDTERHLKISVNISLSLSLSLCVCVCLNCAASFLVDWMLRLLIDELFLRYL